MNDEDRTALLEVDICTLALSSSSPFFLPPCFRLRARVALVPELATGKSIHDRRRRDEKPSIVPSFVYSPSARVVLVTANDALKRGWSWRTLQMGMQTGLSPCLCSRIFVRE